MTSSRSVTSAFISVTTLFFVWGFITSNNDPLIAALKAIFSLSYTEALMTQFAFFIAYGAVSLPAASLLNRLGPVKTVLASLATMIAACFIIQGATLVREYTLVLCGLFVIAAGITTLQVAANPIAANLGDPSKSHFRLTLAQAFNSLGVVLGVHFGSQIMLSGDIFESHSAVLDEQAIELGLDAVNHAFMMIAGLIALLALFIWLSRNLIENATQNLSDEPNSSVFAALKSKWALFGALALFAYVGAEVAIGSLMINFLNQENILGLSLADAGVYLANLYWGGALLGRFVGSALLTRIKAEHLLFGAAAIASCLCIVVSVSDGSIAGYAALLVGFFNATMFPVIFTLTLQRSSAAQSSTSGLLCLSIVGGAILPLVMGYVADITTLSISFIVPVAAYVVISVFAYCAAKAKISHDNVGSAAVSH